MKDLIIMPRFRSAYRSLNEDHHKEASDETSMAKIQLKSIMADSAELLRRMDDADQLDAWVQGKLSVAEDYISTIRKYMEYEEEAKPEELPLIPAGNDEPNDSYPIEAIDAIEPEGGDAMDDFEMEDIEMGDIESFFSEDPEKDPEPEGEEIETSLEDDDEPEELDLESLSQ